jgi:hypothetical protein
MKTKYLVLALCALATLSLTGCADAVHLSYNEHCNPVGFWYGMWHGFISPISFLISLFDDSVSIYSVYNNGGWYDFGFILGMGGLYSSK